MQRMDKNPYVQKVLKMDQDKLAASKLEGWTMYKSFETLVLVAQFAITLLKYH